MGVTQFQPGYQEKTTCDQQFHYLTRNWFHFLLVVHHPHQVRNFNWQSPHRSHLGHKAITRSIRSFFRNCTAHIHELFQVDRFDQYQLPSTFQKWRRKEDQEKIYKRSGTPLWHCYKKEQKTDLCFRAISRVRAKVQNAGHKIPTVHGVELCLKYISSVAAIQDPIERTPTSNSPQ